MKMTKKILMGAVAFAAVMFMGCKEIGDIDWGKGTSGDGTKTFKVKQANDSGAVENTPEYDEGIIRGAKQIDLVNRAGGTCVVKVFNQTNSTKDGVAGFICNYSENKDSSKDNYGTCNFLVIGTQWNKGSARYYVSFYFNIDPNKLSANNFGATPLAYDADRMTPYEVVIKGWTTVSGVTLTGKNNDEFEMAIKVTNETNGDIKVYLMKADSYHCEDQSAQLILNDDASYADEPILVPAAKVGRPTEKAPNGKLFVYANILPGQTLNARWDIYDVTFKQGKFATEDTFEVGNIDWE